MQRKNHRHDQWYLMNEENKNHCQYQQSGIQRTIVSTFAGFHVQLKSIANFPFPHIILRVFNRDVHFLHGNYHLVLFSCVTATTHFRCCWMHVSKSVPNIQIIIIICQQCFKTCNLFIVHINQQKFWFAQYMYNV